MDPKTAQSKRGTCLLGVCDTDIPVQGASRPSIATGGLGKDAGIDRLCPAKKAAESKTGTEVSQQQENVSVLKQGDTLTESPKRARSGRSIPTETITPQKKKKTGYKEALTSS
jgi:hypothetical protein